MKMITLDEIFNDEMKLIRLDEKLIKWHVFFL